MKTHSSVFRILCVMLLVVAAPFASGASAPKSKASDAPKATSTAKIDINTADQATLETLPGIGPATARAIIARRPFAKVSDLEEVPGIGPSKMVDLRDRVRVSRATAAAPEKSKGKGKEVSAEKKSERAKVATAERGATSGRSTTAEPLPPILSPSETGRTTTPPVVNRSERPLEPTGYPSTQRRANPPPVAGSGAGLIDLNTATKEQLESLPEIGPVKAQAIIDGRPYARPEDVMRVKGIKEGTFEVIKDRITVR